jgi:small redox-active disulfide protein 2
MKTIKVLGGGCRNCEVTAELIERAAAEAGVEITLEKVTDMGDILAHGVMSTPGVVIDGQVVHSGGVPDMPSVKSWLSA